MGADKRHSKHARRHDLQAGCKRAWVRGLRKEVVLPPCPRTQGCSTRNPKPPVDLMVVHYSLPTVRMPAFYASANFIYLPHANTKMLAYSFIRPPACS